MGTGPLPLPTFLFRSPGPFISRAYYDSVDCASSWQYTYNRATTSWQPVTCSGKQAAVAGIACSGTHLIAVGHTSLQSSNQAIMASHQADRQADRRRVNARSVKFWPFPLKWRSVTFIIYGGRWVLLLEVLRLWGGFYPSLKFRVPVEPN